MQKKRCAQAKPSIAFFGLGLMGTPMVRRLLAAGYAVSVYDPVQDRVQALVAEGAIAPPPREAAAQAQVIIAMLPEARHVQGVLTGPDGILASLQPGTILLDMSTIAATDCAAFSDMLQAKGCHYVDAPVSGGVGGAEQGTLSIMVGPRRRSMRRCCPFCRCWASRLPTSARWAWGKRPNRATR